MSASTCTPVRTHTHTHTHTHIHAEYVHTNHSDMQCTTAPTYPHTHTPIHKHTQNTHTLTHIHTNHSDTNTYACIMHNCMHLPSMETRHKVEQVKAYLNVMQNPKNPLHDAVKEEKGCRLARGKSWVGQAEQSIQHVCSLTELKQVRDWEKRPVEFKPYYKTLLSENLGTHCREWPAGKTNAEVQMLVKDNSKPHDIVIYTDGSVIRDRSGWGFTVKQGGRTVHEDSGAHRVTITHAVILTDSMSLLQKVESVMGCPDGHTATHSLRIQRLLWIYCPGHAGVSGNERADRQASTADITSGLQLGRAEVLQGLRNFLNTDKPEHHSTDHLKENGVEKGSGRHSTLQGQERSVFNQANIGTVSRATLGRLLREGAEHVWAFPSVTMPSWAETETEIAQLYQNSHTHTHTHTHTNTHMHVHAHPCTHETAKTQAIYHSSLSQPTFLDGLPELVLVSALFKGRRKVDMARTHIPEEDTKGVDVHAVVVVTSEELWSHVDGSANDAARHHSFRLAESQVRDLTVVVFVQLV